MSKQSARVEPDRPPRFDWFNGLVADGALFAVDMTQRVTRWSASGSAVLGDAEQATGRHCYEVMASMDPRNAPFCRPNCPVMAAARHGQPLPDFEVWLPGRSVDRPAQVSILLSVGDDDSVEVLHLVREARKRPSREPASATPSVGSHVRPMLAVLARPAVQEPVPARTLTRRQREVLAGLAGGESVDALAERLALSPVTVRNHVQSAMSALGARSRLEAVLTAVERGLL